MRGNAGEETASGYVLINKELYLFLTAVLQTFSLRLSNMRRIQLWQRDGGAQT